MLRIIFWHNPCIEEHIRIILGFYNLQANMDLNLMTDSIKRQSEIGSNCMFDWRNPSGTQLISRNWLAGGTTQQKFRFKVRLLVDLRWSMDQEEAGKMHVNTVLCQQAVITELC